MFGVPGRLHAGLLDVSHLPGFIESEADKLKSEGVDGDRLRRRERPVRDVVLGRACTGRDREGPHAVRSLRRCFHPKALGLDLDLGAISGCGARSQRYSMVVEDGVVQMVNVEKSIFDHGTSSASSLLGQDAE